MESLLLIALVEIFFATNIIGVYSSEMELRASEIRHQINSDAMTGQINITLLNGCEDSDRWTCKRYNYDRMVGSVRGYYTDYNCGCDYLCDLFRDCCPDYEETVAISSNSGINGAGSPKVPGREDGLSSSGTSKSRQAKVGQLDVYSRHQLTPSMFSCVYESGITEANNVAMVTRCPENWQDVEVAEMCHNVTKNDQMRRLPVSGVSTHALYRNMYCAICHQEKFVYWLPSMNCSSNSKLPFDENSTFADMMDHGNCTLHFQSHDTHFRWRPCLEEGVISTCSAKFPLDSDVNKNITARCEDSSPTAQIVYGFTRAYRNVYCALCNQENFTDLSCLLLTGPSVSKGTRSSLPYSFSILLDINSHTGSSTEGQRYPQNTVQRNITTVCEAGEVYDPFNDMCRQVTCGPGRYFRINKCVTLSDMLHSNGSTGSLDCDVTVQLNDTEFKLYENGSLELLGTDVLYNRSEYNLIDSGALVCVDYTQNYTKLTETNVTEEAPYDSDLTERVISTVGLSISLIAMAVTICVYVSLRPLRNIPGKNLLSLVSALFVAELLLLLASSASGQYILCAVVAAATHYMFLVAFVWMNVMAVDVWFTFSKAFVRAGDRGKSSKRFTMYSVYAWFMPVAFVAPAVVLQILEPESSVSPRYGSRICWLSNKLALLVFFAAPLFLLLILNGVFFLISARTISRARRTSARMLGKEEEEKMAIYVKLTVVLGLTWILGFLWMLVPHPILHYIFITVNTLQGLFIFLSFVINKRVIGLLKDKFRGRRKVRVTRSGSTEQTNLSKSGSLAANRKSSTASTKLNRNVMV